VGGGGGWIAHARWAARRSDVPDAPGDVQRLAARLQLVGDGAWYGFTVDRAATLRFTVELPPGVETSLTWGRLGPGLPGEPAHLPDPATAESIALKGGVNGPFERAAYALGPHVAFVAQPPLSMGDMGLPVRLLVEVAPSDTPGSAPR
jgi:hypothetical protein